MSDPIITVEGLASGRRGKRYRLGASRSGERYTALRDVIAEKTAGVFRKRKAESEKWLWESHRFGYRANFATASCERIFRIMSAADLLEELNALPEGDRSALFAEMIENEEWRHDLLDLITIAERRDEPTRPINDVFRDLKIDA